MDNGKIKKCELFWVEEPSSLYETLRIIPTDDMTDAERLNVITRIVIVISAVMYMVKFPFWWVFLLLALLVIITVWSMNKEQYRCETIKKNPIVTAVIHKETKENKTVNIISLDE